MKKQSGFKLKSGNKPSPAKFYGYIKKALGLERKAARARGVGRMKQFDEYIKKYKS